MPSTSRQNPDIFPSVAGPAVVPGGSIATGPGGDSIDVNRLEKVRHTGNKIIARCPACAEAGTDKGGDHLVIMPDGKFGCIQNAGAAGAEHRRRIFQLAGVARTPAPRPVQHKVAKPPQTWATPEAAATSCTPHGFSLLAVYHYQREGRPFGAVARYQPRDPTQRKKFYPFHWAENAWHLGGAKELMPLYRLEELPSAGPVDVVEGEKCQQAAASVGLAVTCSAGGSHAAKKSDWRPLAGRDVRIWPDNDADGEVYASEVASILHKLGCQCRIVRLPGLSDGGDIADFLADGGDVATIQRLADEAPACEPTELETTAPDQGDPVAMARDGRPYALTDLGNAERLVAWHGDAIRWDTARRCWRVWDGRRWDSDSGLKVQALAADTARRIRKEAAAAPSGGERDLGRELFKHACRSESRDRLAAMCEVAKSQHGVAVNAIEWDSDPWALNVLNGTLDLHTGTLRTHRPGDLLTKLAPVEYRPDARCDRWERFMSDATGGDAELSAFMQLAIGYTLTGDTSEEKLFLVYGPENSGKTTFTDTFRDVLGDYARTIQADLLTKKKHDGGGGAASPELAGLAGARMAAGSEMEQGREMAEALAKNITGGETITARHLYAEYFDFRPQFKIWLAVNHCPKVSADDGAIWRRILRIGFEHTVAPERRDKTLKPWLRNPKGGASAVLAWAVAGCMAWQKKGLNVPEAVKRSTEAYRTESDPLAPFFEDCLTFTAGAWTPWADIWQAYCEHASEQGTADKYRVAPKTLQCRLKAAGGVSERRHEGRGWRHVELSDTPKTPMKPGIRDARDGCDTETGKYSNDFSRRELLGNAVTSVTPDTEAPQAAPEPELVFPADTDAAVRAEHDAAIRHWEGRL